MNDTDQHTSGSAPHTSGMAASARSLLTRWVSKMSSLEVPSALHPEFGRFIRLVREDLEAHGGDWSRPGFQALLVYRFGVWRMSIRSKLWRAPFSISSRALFAAVRNLYGIELPYSATVGRRVVIEHQHGIVVHGDTVIGDDCIIRQGVTLGIRRLDRLTEAPVLGRGVNVGAGAKILGRVYIGDHAEIGANAVVLDDVPPYALAVGVPAHLVARHSGRVPRRERSAISERSGGKVVELTSDGPAPLSSAANSNSMRNSLSRSAPKSRSNSNGSSSSFMQPPRSGGSRRRSQPS